MNELLDRMPPNNRDAERCLLGCLLRDNSVIIEILDLLTEGDFYLDAHQKIFRVIAEIGGTAKPVDVVILADAIKDRDWIHDIGGYSYIVEVYESSPTAANATYYAGIIREKSLYRQMILICNDILRDCYEAKMPADELVADAQRRMMALGNTIKASPNRKLSEVIIEVQAEVDRRCKHQAIISGVPTGLIDLDEMLGGLHAGELFILAARPSVGKTSLAANICRNAAEHGLGSIIFSLEQSRLELATRWMCGEAGVNSHALRKGRMPNDQVSKLIDAGHELSRLPIWINDTPAQRVRNIMASARRLMLSEKINLMVIDYLQLITCDDGRENRNEQISVVTRSAKLMARELNIPILLLSQLSRDSEKQNRRPRLSDLRDSGSIEQDADTVMFLHRPNAQDISQPAEVIEAIVSKQRNGPCGDVPLTFVKAAMRFDNNAPEIPK